MAGASFCVYLIGAGELSGRESAMLSVLLTILSRIFGSRYGATYESHRYVDFKAH